MDVSAVHGIRDAVPACRNLNMQQTGTGNVRGIFAEVAVIIVLKYMLFREQAIMHFYFIAA